MTSTLSGLSWFPIKGLNLVSPPHKVPLDMASDGKNWVINDQVISKRDGYDEVNATAISANPTVNSLGSLYLSSGTKYELIGTSNGDVWKDENGTVTAKILSGFSTTQPVNIVQFLDYAILTDGAITARTWDGTNTGSITAAPLGKYAEVHLNKLFITGIVGADSRVDYSATGDFNRWSGVGVDQFNVEQNNGQIITGLKSFQRNELVIFKERSMYKLVGDTKANFNLVSVDKHIGCVDHRTIQNYEGTLVWAGYNGIYAYDGSSPNLISYYISPLWNTVNRTRYNQICSGLDLENGRYIISFPTGSSLVNDTTIVIDLEHPWQDSNGTHFPCVKWDLGFQSFNTEIISTTDQQRLVFGGDSDGFKYYMGDIYSDNGTSIESEIVTPLMTFEDSLGMDNCLRRAYVAFTSTAGSVQIYTETKDGTDWVLQDTVLPGDLSDAIGIDFTIGLSMIGLPEASFSQRVDMVARSRRIKVRFLMDSDTRYYNMQNPVEFYFKTGGQRR